MTEQARIYGAVLYELSVPEAMANRAEALFADCPELGRCLGSPCVPAQTKRTIIERVFREPEFSGTMIRFLKKACDAGCIGQLKDILQVCRERRLEEAGILEAELLYVTKPDEAQIAGIRRFLCRRCGAGDVLLTMTECPGLIGGFVLKTGDKEYDYSLSGQLNRLRETVSG